MSFMFLELLLCHACRSPICGAPRQTGAKVRFLRFWDSNTIAEIIELPSFWDINEGSRVSTFWDIEQNVNKTRWRPFFEKLRKWRLKIDLKCAWILLRYHYRMTMKFADDMVSTIKNDLQVKNNKNSSLIFVFELSTVIQYLNKLNLDALYGNSINSNQTFNLSTITVNIIYKVK